MLVIQHHWRRWTAPGRQTALPGSAEVQVSPERVFGWGQVFDWSDDAVRSSRMRLDRRPDGPWRPLEWRGGALEIEIGLHKPDGLRSQWDQGFHAPNWLFTLKGGQIGRIRWNGRFSARGAIGPCFEDHEYWIGVGDPDPDMFRDRPLHATHERLHLRG
ncbi:MAG: hypothetical protein ACXW3O_04575 [Brevundimonas sp.]